jgi:L,D-peptidoglycan transpeptidase YkuD (ErfK/YbiS/YcfS/YnhG family)
MISKPWYGANKESMNMSLRFRKRIKIFPGIWFNLSKSGISTSIGGKGLTVNLKDGKTKTTVGIPGSGLSYSETSGGKSEKQTSASRPIQTCFWATILVIIALVLILK